MGKPLVKKSINDSQSIAPMYANFDGAIPFLPFSDGLRPLQK